MTTAAAPKLTKAGLVRGLPEDMSVEDVIAAGKKKGLEIKAADVHAARYYMRQTKDKGVSSKKSLKATKKAANGEKKTASAANGAKTNGAGNHAPKKIVRKPRATLADDSSNLEWEMQFRGLIVRVGTSRARQLIEAIETSQTFGNAS